MAKIKDLAPLLYNIKSLDVDNKEDIEFLGFCLSNIFKIQSQNFQDVWALYENNFNQFGFYVEFGATNGIGCSNTYFLEKYHMWCGILAEPNPIWHDELNKNRSKNRNLILYDCIYNNSNETIDFVATPEADLSTINGFGLDDEHADKRKGGNVVKVKTITLVDMLEKYEAPKNINYMSVDTEGSEYEILKSFFDNSKSKEYNIKCVTIEHNFVEKNRKMLYDLMTANGYKRKFENFSRWDDFYLKV